MANLLLSWRNWVFASTTVLSSDSEVSGLGITNVANRIVQVPHRSLSTAFYGLADFGSNVEVGVLALMFPRSLPMIASTDTIRHRLSAVSAGAGELLDTTAVASGVVAGWGYHLYKLSAAVNARWWRWDISAPSLASRNAVDTGVAWAGPAFTPVRNYSYGWGRSWGDTSRIDGNAFSGVEYVSQGARPRQIELALETLTAAEADSVEDMQAVVGIAQPILACLDPGATDIGRRSIYGRVALSPITHRAFPIHAAPFRITEAL